MAFFSRMKSLGFGKDKTNDPEPTVGDRFDSDADLLAVARKAKSSNDHAESNSSDEWEDVAVYKPAPAPTVKVKKRSSGDRSGKSPRHLPTHKKPRATTPMEKRTTTPRSSRQKDASFVTPTPTAAHHPNTRAYGPALDNDSPSVVNDSNNGSPDSENDDVNFVLESTDMVVDGNNILSPQKDQVSPKKGNRSAATRANATSKAKPRQPPVKAGIRVKSRRSQLFHCLSPELQVYLPQEHPNYQNYYGTVVKKSLGRKAAYDVKFDVFRDNETATGLRREVFTTVKRGEEEPPMDPKYMAKMQMEEDAQDEELKDPEEILCEKEFVKLDSATLRDATTFSHRFHKKKPPIEWTILSPTEDITNCRAFALLQEKFDDGAIVNPNIDFQNMSNSDLFLERFIPNVKGIAKRIDEYHQDERARYFVTVRDRKIKINDDTDEDPDWKIKQFILLTIKGAAVHGKGVDTLWRSGMLEGNIPAADFGQFMDAVEYKVIADALPFMFADKNLWYRDRRDIPWDVFMPFVNEWNSKQRALFKDYNLVVIDETMFAWVPKTSKLGGLPNYTFEVRKPKPLGTMARDGSECSTGCVVNTDPVMNPSCQDKKMFANCPSHAPDAASNGCHPPHVSETLRQVYNANLQQGDWVCGDAWFGSVQTALALKLEEVVRVVTDDDGNEQEKRESLGVDCSFVVKNNSALFPKGPLRAVLKARHPKRIAGHWVVFTTTIKGVDLKAIAYAWNNRDIAYIITTLGNTKEALNPYVAFDANTGFDGGDTKMYARPEIIEFFFRFLPHIDVYNRLRQHSIQLEDQWPTKNCWLKLFNCYLGQSIINQTKLLAYVYPTVPGRDLKATDMAASIASGLRVRERNVLPLAIRQQEMMKEPLGRVSDSTGNSKKKLTPKQLENKRRSSGSSMQRSCYVCRKYKETYSMATGVCQRCGTCLCLPKRYPNCPLTCQEEHLTSPDPAIRCNGVKKSSFPKASRSPNFMKKQRTRHHGPT